ncbi:Transforming growth factor beta regulator 1 [Pleurotus pulmonarius]
MDSPSSPISSSKEPQDIRDKYTNLKRRFMELEDSPVELQRNVRMREERDILLERITEIESQPGFVVPLDGPSSATSSHPPTLPPSSLSQPPDGQDGIDGQRASTSPSSNNNNHIRPSRRKPSSEAASPHIRRTTRSSSSQNRIAGIAPNESGRDAPSAPRNETAQERPDIALKQRGDHIDGEPLANSANEGSTHPNSAGAVGEATQSDGEATAGKRNEDAEQNKPTPSAINTNTATARSLYPRHNIPPPPGQALAALLSASSSHMQIDPTLMENHGVKNTVDMASGGSLTQEYDNQASAAQQEAPTANQTASTSPATSSPSSATPSSSINPYAFLYGAMSPLSAVPTTPSSATPLTPSFPYPNLYYPYPIAMPPGMFVPPPGFVPPAPSQEPQQRPPPDPPRGTKPKRLKAHTVTTKSFSIPTVPRDKSGKPMLPLNVGIMTVISLGEVCMREHFHTERYIFPVGYEVTRRYLSTVDQLHEVVYHCTILDGGDGPKFQIVPSDTPDRPVIAGTATGAWSSIVKQANAIRNRQHSNSVSGPDFFGLGQNTIKHLIQELPNANRLRDYVWQNFVEGGPLGGRHAAVIPALPEDYDAAHPIGPYYPSVYEKMKRQKQADGDGAGDTPRSYYPPHLTGQASSSSENGGSDGGAPSPPPTASSSLRGKRKASAKSPNLQNEANDSANANSETRHIQSIQSLPYVTDPALQGSTAVPAPFAAIMNAYTAAGGSSNDNIG